MDSYSTGVLQKWITLIVLSMPLPALGQEHSTTDTDDVVVVRFVKSNYQDKTFDSDSFRTTIDNSLGRKYTVQPQQNASALVKDHLRLWQQAAPTVYNDVLAYAQRNSPVEDINKLKPGDVVVLPDIPKMSRKSTRDRASIGAGSSRYSYSANWDGEQKVFIGDPQVKDRLALLSKTEKQVRVLSFGEAKKLELAKGDMSYQEIAEKGLYGLGSLNMELRLMATPGAPNPGLSAKERTALANLLASTKSPANKPLLVILDDTWPDAKEFEKAAKFTLKASQEIRTAYGMPTETGDAAKDMMILKAGFENGTRFCSDTNCEYPFLKHHSAMIKESLKDFTAADKDGLVEVLYLPTGIYQTYATNILREMVRLANIAGTVETPRVQVPGTYAGKPKYYPSAIPAPQYSHASEEALSKVFSSNGIGNEPMTFDFATPPTEPWRIYTNKGIIDGVFNFFWLYSQAARRPVFISLSWTTPKLEYSTLFRDYGATAWFAAVGNTKGVDITSNPVDFASRNTFIAVQNVSDAGCPTSTFNADPSVLVQGLIFDGSVHGSICGTSFSTPRIAWILAAREAIKGQPLLVDGEPNWVKFRARNRTFITTQTTQSKDAELRYRRTIWDLLEEPAP